MKEPRHHESWRSEGGFTLPEALIVIVFMGIVPAIASSTWFGLVESRRVDSATNQMVSDLRLAHTSATNRLAEYEVRLSDSSSNPPSSVSSNTTVKCHPEN